MQHSIWRSLKGSVSLWRVWALPGLVVIGLVTAARLTGSLQSLELIALDSFLRLRPAEPADDRITLIGIDGTDIQKTGYPIPDRELVSLVKTLQTYKPAAIGLNILQNQIAKDNTDLFATLNDRQRLIVTEQLLPAASQIPPPPGFPTEAIGLADILTDGDNHLRRVLLGSRDPIEPENLKKYRLSLTIRLVEKYLTAQNSSLTLQNGIRDKSAMRFGDTELPRFLANSGGYVQTDPGGPQILLNFRSGRYPFRLLTLKDLTTGKVDPTWLRDRIVIIGITDPRIRPAIPTATVVETNSLQIQAHAVSQIISAVLDGRSLLKTWTDPWEYLWILGWGSIAIVLGRSNLLPKIKLISIGAAQVCLIGGSYLLLLAGWWLPVIPASLVWLLNGLTYTAFYKYDWVLRSRLRENQRIIEERQHTIEQTFNVIHNGPLQTLASLLRRIRDSSLSQEQLLTALEGLNAEIRGIGEHIKQETLTQEYSLYLGSGIKVDLELPIHELFYEVYSNTLERLDFPRFETLKVTCYFEPIEQRPLNFEQKRSLCRFLEEALCNVGKHAEGASTLKVTGTHQTGGYSLQIIDNGTSILSSAEGEGTKQARRIAAQLGGKFRRESVSPRGTLCEITFPLGRSWWRSYKNR